MKNKTNTKQELPQGMLDMMDFIVHDRVHCHNAESDEEVIGWVKDYVGDIPEDVIKECIRKHCKAITKEADADLKDKDSECIYKHDYRLPGSGWSNQK